MPQKKSYFALQLPKGWWVFGLDQALHCDIDVYQFKFFSELVKKKVSSLYPEDCIMFLKLQFVFLCSFVLCPSICFKGVTYNFSVCTTY